MKALILCVVLASAAWPQTGEWIPLFDGKTLNGWKANENPGSFRIESGAIATTGPRTHLFYTGPVSNANFKNFELEVEAKGAPGANSGVFFHTAFQPKGWLQKGFEVQIDNTHVGEGNYRERKKTGSLYGIRNVYKELVKDNEWFRMNILVRGKNVQIRVNGTLVVDYVEADPPVNESEYSGRVLDHGTFALQCHDVNSRAWFRSIRVRALPDSAISQAASPVVDPVYRQILRLSDRNYPVVDYHVHLKGGLTLEEALAESRRVGIAYGIAVNGGLSFPIKDDAAVLDYLKTIQDAPVFTAFQAEGREWVTLFSRSALRKFDYVFTDAMTFTGDDGRRMRLWLKDEVGEIKDPQAFMEMAVKRIEGVLNNEPIDIYVNPTFLPEAISAQYDALWTPERIARVVNAAKRNSVAVEINNRYKIPHLPFIKAGKQAGVKFTCGTNNAERELGRMEYCLQMIQEAGLTWQDMWVPASAGQKAVDRKPGALKP